MLLRSSEVLLRSTGATEVATEGTEVLLISTEVAPEGTKVLLRDTEVLPRSTEVATKETEVLPCHFIFIYTNNWISLDVQEMPKSVIC